MAELSIPEATKQRVIEALANADNVRTMIQKMVATGIWPASKLEEHDKQTDQLRKIKQQFVD